jgi:hypothetical protein
VVVATAWVLTGDFDPVAGEPSCPTAAAAAAKKILNITMCLFGISGHPESDIISAALAVISVR